MSGFFPWLPGFTRKNPPPPKRVPRSRRPGLVPPGRRAAAAPQRRPAGPLRRLGEKNRRAKPARSQRSRGVPSPCLRKINPKGSGRRSVSLLLGEPSISNILSRDPNLSRIRKERWLKRMDLESTPEKGRSTQLPSGLLPFSFFLLGRVTLKGSSFPLKSTRKGCRFFFPHVIPLGI